MFDGVEEIEENIKLVTEAVRNTALETLPLHKPRKGRYFNDPTLKQLTVKSKAAWKTWSDAGKPSEGPLHDSKLFWRREVRKRINVCAAMAERKRQEGSKCSDQVTETGFAFPTERNPTARS